MAYASIGDLQTRSRQQIQEKDWAACLALLEDAAVIVDSYNRRASDEAKKLVSCNMVIRAIGSMDASQAPIGATQGTVSGLGYSQTWNMGSGSSGELYLTKVDKKLLGAGSRIGFSNPFMEDPEC